MGFEKFEPIQPYGSNRLSQKFQEEQDRRERDVSEAKSDKDYVKLVNNSKSKPFKAALLPEAGSLAPEVLGLYLESGKGEFLSRFQIIALLMSGSFKDMAKSGRLSLFSKSGRIIFARREGWLSGGARFTYEQGEIARLDKEAEEELIRNGIALKLNQVCDFE